MWTVRRLDESVRASTFVTRVQTAMGDMLPKDAANLLGKHTRSSWQYPQLLALVCWRLTELSLLKRAYLADGDNLYGEGILVVVGAGVRVVRDQLFGLAETHRDNTLQEVHELLCVCPVGEVEIHALQHSHSFRVHRRFVTPAKWVVSAVAKCTSCIFLMLMQLASALCFKMSCSR